MEEEREEALDLSRMPKSFPMGQAGEPTPGTTNLHEPPQEPTKPPRMETLERVVIDLQDDDEPPGISTLHKISTLETLMETVSKQLSDLKARRVQFHAWACQVSCRAHLVQMGAISYIRFVRARGKLVETISLIRHFVHGTFVRVCRRIQRIRMRFRLYRKDN